MHQSAPDYSIVGFQSERECLPVIELLANMRFDQPFKLLQSRIPSATNVSELKVLYGKSLNHFQKEPEAAAELGENREHAALTLVANVLLNLDGTLTKE